jgi:NADPH-dependent glutamate synthase beta subunit-like oxidoreductase/coenzyme F420-reducing hydrogenase delta subunit/Pyruvate/2-oxoacid:ferredoxin oxidoreductase delta subunit
MPEVDLTSKDIAALERITDLMERQWAPCRYACPAHADVRSYLEAAAEGDLRRSIDIIRENLPFAAVCGRVCHHPCETNCRREGVDDPVAIREVKRFVAETQGADGSTVIRPQRQDKARVAVVGAGPAGLSAARDLAMLGYRPTVFEKHPVAGGIPATAIPRYRLPLEVTQIDVDWICAHGVELVTGVEVGRDRTIEQLLDEGFEAVLVAAGLARSRPLPMPGADADGVLASLEFLTRINLGEAPEIGRDVVVIGGGNVACDAARSAFRLGAERVRMVCLENSEEMPAWDWEREEAEEEGVEILFRRGPVEVLTDGGRVVGLRTRGVTRVFDDAGRFAPEYDDADLADVDCDTVIISIGQMADTGFADGGGLELDERGRLVCDPATHQTSRPNVFACGEIVTPPGSVVEASAHGRRAAAAIDQYLSGRPIEIDDELPPKIEEIPDETGEKVRPAPRNPVPTRPAHERRTRFDAIDETYAEPAALAEARRCMSCGAGAEVLSDKCAACLTCLRVCPFDIPVVTDTARIESERCQSCGICIAECPANAIVARGRPLDELEARTALRLGRSQAPRRVVAYVSGFRATADDWRAAAAGDGDNGTIRIYLPSTARLDVSDILAAFENEADAVLVVTCPDGTERYPQTAERTRRRVAQARELLAEIALAQQALRLLAVAPRDRAALHAAIDEAPAPA